jgi:hypothetical protein
VLDRVGLRSDLSLQRGACVVRHRSVSFGRRWPYGALRLDATTVLRYQPTRSERRVGRLRAS